MPADALGSVVTRIALDAGGRSPPPRDSQTGGFLSHNNAVVLAGIGSTNLWAAYSKYFNDMWVFTGTTKDYRPVQGIVTGTTGDVQFFPRDYPGADHMSEVVDAVDCADGSTIIRIASIFRSAKKSDGTWNPPIVSALRKAKKRGCQVWIVTDLYKAGNRQ
ncbi:hypothetical protein ACIBF6_10495 [Streptosporangium amethystogenes]|uniref:hypothetical protein n=1 Tax=Streptosporangium amethystogenes TaxID=2002 RepID=UPI0037B9D19C